MACRHVDGDDDRARQVRRGQPDVLSDWEGAQVAGVDGDKSMISKSQDQDSASTQWTSRANKVQRLWASLLFGRLAWRLAPPCGTQATWVLDCAVFTGSERTGVSHYQSTPRTAFRTRRPMQQSGSRVSVFWPAEEVRRVFMPCLHLSTAARVWLHSASSGFTGQEQQHEQEIREPGPLGT